MNKRSNLIDNLNTFHNGTLPVIEQHIHKISINILRCSYWLMREWHHDNLASPYWRLYWNKEPGAYVEYKKIVHELGPDRLVLIVCNTPFKTRIGGRIHSHDDTNVMIGSHCKKDDSDITGDVSSMIHHFFIHFTMGHPYDLISPGIYGLPITPQIEKALHLLTTRLEVDRSQFNHQHSLAMHTLIYSVLNEIPEDSWPKRQTSKRIINVIEYMDKNYYLQISNSDLARIANMNPNAFVRLFKSKTMLTPMAYLKNKRIEHASILLHHTDNSIESIAELCGFCDRNYFTKIFCKVYGVGPATYRKTRLS